MPPVGIAALCIVLPIALQVIVRVKNAPRASGRPDRGPVFYRQRPCAGAALHSIVFSSFPTLIQSPGLYTAYACLAAGVLKRRRGILAWSLLCRRDASLVTGFAYGIGHGGIEAILLAGTTSLSNAIVLSAARGGSLEAMFGSDIAATVQHSWQAACRPGRFCCPGWSELPPSRCISLSPFLCGWP